MGEVNQIREIHRYPLAVRRRPSPHEYDGLLQGDIPGRDYLLEESALTITDPFARYSDGDPDQTKVRPFSAAHLSPIFRGRDP